MFADFDVKNKTVVEKRAQCMLLKDHVQSIIKLKEECIKNKSTSNAFHIELKNYAYNVQKKSQVKINNLKQKNLEEKRLTVMLGNQQKNKKKR